MNLNVNFTRGHVSSSKCKRPNRTGKQRRGWEGMWRRRRTQAEIAEAEAHERQARETLAATKKQQIKMQTTDKPGWMSRIKAAAKKALGAWG